MTDAADEIARREGEKLVAHHTAALENIETQMDRLTRRRDFHQAELQKAELSAQGIKPCAVCNRHVPSPCNSKGGLAENGPWDGFCREFMDNRP